MEPRDPEQSFRDAEDQGKSRLLPGKIPEMILIKSLPMNAEPPPHFLDDEVTPYAAMFVRDNGVPPERADPATWTLTIDGEAASRPLTLTAAELKNRFKPYTYQIQLECAGNGRAAVKPLTPGEKWRVGAVSCAEWTGARLRDVLEAVGLKKDAVYIGYYGADAHLSGDPGQEPISRGVPLAKALEDESLIAWAMNGEEIPLPHGSPLRLITGGWPASTCGKWLKRIVIRNVEHDGAKMTGSSYRMPAYPVAPGTSVPDRDMVVIGSMPVKSIITHPPSGSVVPLAQPLEVRGHAWAGDLSVRAMEVSVDFGSTWQSCELKAPRNRLAWQRWTAGVRFPIAGYYEIWARATDQKGGRQPMVVPGWNPEGYLNNACHRIAIQVI